MKKFTKTLFLMLFFAALNAGFAAEHEFQILAKEGNVKLKTAKSSSYSTAKTGAKLFKDDKLQLKRGAYVALYHKSTGKTSELKSAGTYSISKLSKDIKKGQKGLNKKFADYVINEVSGGDNLFSAGGPGEMNILGSAERQIGNNDTKSGLKESGLNDDASEGVIALADFVSSESDDVIYLIAARATFLMDNYATFQWKKDTDSKNYELHIMDKNDKEVYKTKTNDTTIKVDLEKAKLSQGENYYWYVSSGDKKSDQYILNRLTDKELLPIKQTLASVSDDRTAIENILLASYFEDLNLAYDAKNAYEAAIKLAPDVKEYKRLYCAFLYRTGFFDEATTVYANEI